MHTLHVKLAQTLSKAWVGGRENLPYSCQGVGGRVGKHTRIDCTGFEKAHGSFQGHHNDGLRKNDEGHQSTLKKSMVPSSDITMMD